ncbi:hypothetical protein [Hymenobacter swuensis]|uniref:hypothetical protein n=1 Tax=Hymenobacter swuensis TaxID=1446467 RepID=UPI0005C6EEEC|nr:hypothetical protein [Hymenobacter swuensis]
MNINLVLDLAFGDKLLLLHPAEPAWVVASVLNEPLVRQQWQASAPQPRDITLFQPSTGLDFESLLDTVNQHHGEDSHGPAYTSLTVFGLDATDPIVEILAGFAFHVAQTTRFGFIAHRIPHGH